LVDLSRSAPPSTVGVLGGQFSLSADRVAALQNEHGLSEDELLSMLITPASELARPRISSFHVGAAGIGASGAMYLGCNLEFARLPLYNSIHAEQFLLVNALHCGERGIRKVAVSAAPCGHCRQFYTELNCAETIRFSFSGGTYSLGQLLPMRFRPSDLLTDPNTPLLLDPQCNPLELTPDAKAKVSRLASTGDDAPLAIAAHAALEQARTSYAPYSRCPAGVAIVAEDGSVHGGGVIESAAFNPSLPPLQTAIIDAVLDGMPTYTTVRDVVLVELEGGHVQHAGATRAALEQIAPDARLTVFHVQWAEASKG
jgi:cytidine deaminase